MGQAPTILKADADGIDAARRLLVSGKLVGIPTETVYGLAADATNPDAIARVFDAKRRPAFNPLISHIASLDAAMREGQLDARAQALAKAFWPGPLTLVVPVTKHGLTCELARAGLESIGLRMPSHSVASELLQVFGQPIAAPSANPSGRLSPTRAIDVAQAFGEQVAAVLDGGACERGIESTIVAIRPGMPATVLRPGAIATEDIARLVDVVAAETGGPITSPGQLASHYAPNARLRLNASHAQPGERLLGFGRSAPADCLNLSPSGSLVEAAANLYRMLRELDATGAEVIAVMPVPATGIGEAINDRLRRAAAPRGPGQG